LIEHITCKDCLQEGKEQQPIELIAKDGPITSVVCPHCGTYKENLKMVKMIKR